MLWHQYRVCVLQSTRHMWRRVLTSNHLKFKFSIDNLIYYNFTNNFQTMLKFLKQRMILVPIDLVKNGKSNMFLIVITNKTNRMITIARKSEKRK